jgi:uncharacterized membrane protein
MNELVTVALLALTPVVELRGSIPYGIAVGLNPVLVVFVSIVFNILAAPLAYLVLSYVVGLFQHVQWFHNFWEKIVVRSQNKVRLTIDRYGVLGLALFIAVPLPGTGVYTAAIGAYALGFKLKELLIATVFGVCIAAVAVTAVVLLGKEAWLWLT